MDDNTNGTPNNGTPPSGETPVVPTTPVAGQPTEPATSGEGNQDVNPVTPPVTPAGAAVQPPAEEPTAPAEPVPETPTTPVGEAGIPGGTTPPEGSDEQNNPTQ